jgi:hypothetical protein
MPLLLAVVDERLQSRVEIPGGDDHRIRCRRIGGQEQQSEKGRRHAEAPSAL